MNRNQKAIEILRELAVWDVKKDGYPAVGIFYDRIAPLIEDGTLDFQGATTVTSIHEDKVVLDGPDGPVIVPNDEVFILAGGIPPFGFLRELGVKFGGDQRDIVAAAG